MFFFEFVVFVLNSKRLFCIQKLVLDTSSIKAFQYTKNNRDLKINFLCIAIQAFENVILLTKLQKMKITIHFFFGLANAINDYIKG